MNYITVDDNKIRIIDSTEITKLTKKLLIEINHNLSTDVVNSLKEAEKKERSAVAKNVLCRLCENIVTAKDLDVPICQDTGMAVIFAGISVFYC